ncbi:hypothetical protein HanRHA438_Chr15g0718461 [Helianthus annuus]|uniref:Uncharacterized protein n=1 Tax=Helianthus annuus TaxID=4232 RepID=A0A251SAN2_HELAN|nr:hypothetical protein HanXRQr2_Chr15g0706221 [Helianthus annuus]KAJ0452142.1 hypothetical protein HanHA300_Chr15g0575601 [Helianthus annuus]KAJ0456940.1 hypothetical protein HanIR_Chr15g0768181 [Helianthus annuus]KAJ0474048.1 hypothetical protein HanHA89_Chr15g0625321 [Helianthus annuus]KAJ0649612.1 hypothetical protein HanLR1_Chr15g0586311 [Helianthus annuus]
MTPWVWGDGGGYAAAVSGGVDGGSRRTAGGSVVRHPMGGDTGEQHHQKPSGRRAGEGVLNGVMMVTQGWYCVTTQGREER